MADARWIKLRRDLRADRARALIMIIGVAAGVFGVGTVLGARAILTREMRRNYLGTRPATAVFEVSDAPAALVAQVRRQPGVDGAEGRATIHARVEAGATPGGDRPWRPLVLFVAPGERMPEVGRFTLLGGAAWPPPAGTIFVERAAAALLPTRPGDALRVRLP